MRPRALPPVLLWLAALLVAVALLAQRAPAQAQSGDTLRVATKPLAPFVFTTGDAPVLRYHSVSAGRGAVEVIEGVFKPEKYGIALPPGSELRESINEVLLEMYQDGTLSEIEGRWFNE